MSNIRAVAVTVSDRCARGDATDVSGPVLVNALEELGAVVVETKVVSDDPQTLTEALLNLTSRDEINLVITTGGTGLAPRDNTPEVTKSLVEREVPGLSEAMRAASICDNANAMLSRGVCGVRDGTLIINLPGSPAAVRECFAVIAPVLPHAVKMVSGDTEH